jgi:hypothetical protein
MTRQRPRHRLFLYVDAQLADGAVVDAPINQRVPAGRPLAGADELIRGGGQCRMKDP